MFGGKVLVNDQCNGFLYVITNKVTKMKYVGLTTVGVAIRFDQHLRSALNGKNTKLGRAIREHGPENFRVRTLLTSNSKTELAEAERKYILRYNSVENGYNTRNGGVIGRMGGRLVVIGKKKFNSIHAAAAHFGMNESTLRDRLNKGQKITAPITHNGRVILHDGIRFPSFPALAAHLHMTTNTVRWRYYNGKPLGARLQMEKSRV